MTDLIARPVVDVSHYQRPENCNWTTARDYGICGTIIKASQGSVAVDPAFATHMWDAYQAGIPLLGAYHFLDDSDPVKQANHFLDVVSDDFGGNLTDRLLALDLEGNPMGASETVAAAGEVAQAIFTTISRWVVLYVGRYGPDGKGTGLPNATLCNSDLWLPSYGTVPRLPKGWLPPGEDATAHGGLMRLWQDTDGTANNGAPVPGLGRVDQSQAVGFASLESLTEWWGR